MTTAKSSYPMKARPEYSNIVEAQQKDLKLNSMKTTEVLKVKDKKKIRGNQLIP